MSIDPIIPGVPTLRHGETAAEYSFRVFGGPTRMIESRVTVAQTATRLLTTNPRRLFWLIVNNSVQLASLGGDQTVTFNNGIVVGPSGGYVSMSVLEDGEAVAAEMYAICQSVPGSFYTMEIVRV